MEKAPPVTDQPTAAAPGALTPMPMPTGVEGVPQGLEYLTQVDQLLIHQLVEMLEGTYKYSTVRAIIIETLSVGAYQAWRQKYLSVGTKPTHALRQI